MARNLLQVLEREKSNGSTEPAPQLPEFAERLAELPQDFERLVAVQGWRRPAGSVAIERSPLSVLRIPSIRRA
jgi:hypothetical protein